MKNGRSFVTSTSSWLLCSDPAGSDGRLCVFVDATSATSGLSSGAAIVGPPWAGGKLHTAISGARLVTRAGESLRGVEAYGPIVETREFERTVPGPCQRKKAESSGGESANPVLGVLFSERWADVGLWQPSDSACSVPQCRLAGSRRTEASVGPQNQGPLVPAAKSGVTHSTKVSCRTSHQAFINRDIPFPSLRRRPRSSFSSSPAAVPTMRRIPVSTGLR